MKREVESSLILKNNKYLNLLSVSSLREYATTYLGDLPDTIDNNGVPSIEIINDDKLGKIYKITYLYYNDFEPFPFKNVEYIGAFGILYKENSEFLYLPITAIETKTFYKFMCKKLEELSDDSLNSYQNDFLALHKTVYKDYLRREKKMEKQKHKNRIKDIYRKYQFLDAELDLFDIDNPIIEEK